MRWFDSSFDYIREFIESWNKKVKHLKWTLIAVAVVLVLVGVLCILFPIEVFTMMHILAAAALVVQGIYSIVSYAATTYYFRDPMQLVMGILNIVLGILVLASPVTLTASSLTVMFAFLLLFSGAEKIAFAGKLRYYRIMRTGLMTFSGVLSILLAVVFLVLPLASILILNYIVAAYLIISGIALFIEALGMKRIDL